MNIIDIISEVCKSTGKCIGKEINFLFGDTVYINTILKTYSKSANINGLKFPLIALHTPFVEKRGYNKQFEAESELSLTIAVKTLSGYTNEKRLNESFKKQLHPMYKAFMDSYLNHKLIYDNYDDTIPHLYRERYDLGSRGAMDSKGKTLDDLIDAIELENLEIKVKKEICYGIRG